MIFDMKKKKLYRDLEDWVECNCLAEKCIDCPISGYNNGKKCICSEFVKLYPDSTLELLWDRVKEVQSEAEIKKELEGVEMENMENVKDMENMENMENMEDVVNMKKNQIWVIEENVPPLCHLLGVHPYRAFSYKGEDHRVFAIDENGVRYERMESGWGISYDEENLVKFIQHPERVVVLNEALGLKDLTRMRKAQEKLMKILPDVETVKELDGRVYIQVKTKRGTSELVEINLEKVEMMEG